MRPSSFQRIDIALSRDLQTDYDKIKVIADNIDAIESISNAIDNGIDFGDIAALATTVSEHTAELDTKVDKEVGKSLMTDAEHTKLQFIQQQATKNQADVYLLDRVNHTGTQDLDTTTDGVDRFAMTAAERAKLATVEDRANHTGTQSIDTITDSLSRMAMTNEEKTKLAGIEDSANNYVHPNKHSVTVLDGTGQFSKVVKTDGAGVVGFGDVSWAEVGGKPTTFVPTAHEHSLDDVTSGTIAAARIVMSEGRQFINAEQATAILDMEVKSNKGIPLGYAPLDANGKLNPSYLNDLNLIEVFTPADLNSMLNLNSAQPGDIAYRLDTEATYMLVALPVNTVGNWKQLNAGMSVVSVNGLTGVVNLNTANIAEGGSNYYFTNERVDDRVAALLQAGTNVTLSYDDVGNTLTINANDTSVNWSEIQSKPTTVAGYAISDVSTTSQMNTALALKANLASPTFTGTVGGITATMVGLGNVNNTSDANKPVSTAQATAIGLKADTTVTTAINTTLANSNIARADKYLAAQNIANMVYSSGNLVKIQYNAATDVDYEVLAYASGNLATIQHYTSSVLRGTTTLTYSSGTLISAVYA